MAILGSVILLRRLLMTFLNPLKTIKTLWCSRHSGNWAAMTREVHRLIRALLIRRLNQHRKRQTVQSIVRVQLLLRLRAKLKNKNNKRIHSKIQKQKKRAEEGLLGIKMIDISLETHQEIRKKIKITRTTQWAQALTSEIRKAVSTVVYSTRGHLSLQMICLKR